MYRWINSAIDISYSCENESQLLKPVSEIKDIDPNNLCILIRLSVCLFVSHSVSGSLSRKGDRIIYLLIFSYLSIYLSLFIYNLSFYLAIYIYVSV